MMVNPYSPYGQAVNLGGGMHGLGYTWQPSTITWGGGGSLPITWNRPVVIPQFRTMGLGQGEEPAAGGSAEVEVGYRAAMQFGVPVVTGLVGVGVGVALGYFIFGARRRR